MFPPCTGCLPLSKCFHPCVGELQRHDQDVSSHIFAVFRHYIEPRLNAAPCVQSLDVPASPKRLSFQGQCSGIYIESHLEDADMRSPPSGVSVPSKNPTICNLLLRADTPGPPRRLSVIPSANRHGISTAFLFVRAWRLPHAVCHALLRHSMRDSVRQNLTHDISLPQTSNHQSTLYHDNQDNRNTLPTRP